MMDNFKMMNFMEKDASKIKIQPTKVILMMEFTMVKENSKQKIIFMLVTFEKEILKVKDLSKIQMGRVMKDNLFSIEKMDMELINIKMGVPLLVNGKMMLGMERERLFIQTGIHSQVNLLMTNNMVKLSVNTKIGM